MGFAAISLSAVLWGLEYVLMKKMLGLVAWPAVALVTYSGAFLVLLAWTLLTRSFALPQSRSVLRGLLLIGLIGTSINLCAIKGLQLTTPASVAVIQRMQILFAMLLGWLGLRERVRIADLVPVTAMIGGFLAMHLSRRGAGGFDARALGNLLVLASAFLLALNALLIKRLAQRLDRQAIAVLNCLIIAAGMAVVCVVTETDLRAVCTPVCAWLALGLALLAGTSLLLYYVALARLEIWKVSTMCLLTPVTSALAQGAILGEALNSRQVAGMTCILAGAAVLIWLHQRRSAVEASSLTPAAATARSGRDAGET